MCDNINDDSNKTTLFPSINTIENHYRAMLFKKDLLEDDLLSDIINKIDQRQVIKLFKKLYRDKGINLRTNRPAFITIQTEYRKITIRRYLLSPINSLDKELLYKLEGKKNIYPADVCLGIDTLPFKTSVSAMLKIAKIAQKMKSYKDTQKELEEFHRIKMDDVTISSITNHIGSIVLNNDIQTSNNCYNELLKGTITFPNNKKDEILYIQTDGAMVNTRQIENIDTEKKSGWHENKLALVYTSGNVRLKSRVLIDGVYENKHEIIKKEYTSYIGEVSLFKKLVLAAAIRNGYGHYKETVLISDGATWIRNMKDELFPDALQILDFYHLSEKIWDFGKLYYNKNENKYLAWCHKICEELRKSNIISVLSQIKTFEKKIDIKKNKLSVYIENNINNIDYASYIKKGYIIGSGAIESANKSVMQIRVKQPGMRWNIDSARYMVALRAKYESNLWFDDVIVPVKMYYNINPY
jgi:hypothetical protein